MPIGTECHFRNWLRRRSIACFATMRKTLIASQYSTMKSRGHHIINICSQFAFKVGMIGRANICPL
eukprot:scaffold106171_cov78-Attheya_sp.AAC.1